jgi:1,4-dihydroxy-2-naphthoyl-CoA hydrolase
MYIAKNKVRMHDTDVAGVIYFQKQFRFAHDALEDFAESEGFQFSEVFRDNEYVFVVVHAEADYLMPLRLGDQLEIHLGVEHIGNSSFAMRYFIYKEGVLAGRVQTVHVTLDGKTRTKITIPTNLLNSLKKHLLPEAK